ncbi:CubicO group peptidase (beta-lactamase class C family) [Motilibacter rhizosphaerae]|uniref:CubicO group peptidase (Beta-lactamase class C family) n=1 Tax=Motilibacter rhizosphaerae TaxID=598652 RepID=A0A4Q7NYQ7_9ACTN|nr:serine hydrolase [Motilibacter rhizosphaerae]RZS91542.1 CubicO group peptidase (beta-lactamase class C family) [Motilibacter rhizosphaerae]
MADLPRSTPSEQGVDPAGVLALLDALDAHPEIWPHSLVLVRRGAVVAEGSWSPWDGERPQLVYSLSKGFTSTAAGLAVAEGLFGLDDLVLDHYPELAGEPLDERWGRLRVRHLLSMASGHAADTVDHLEDKAHPVRSFLRIPPDAEPGTLFAYNQPCTYTVGELVTRTSGEGLTDFLQGRLFDRIGVHHGGWLRLPNGQEVASSGFFTTTGSVARHGLLLLQRGRWDGEQLLPEAWVDEASKVHVPTPDAGGPDWEQGYGFQFWRSRHGFRGDGAFGQYCLVLPEQDAVLALFTETTDMGAVLDLVWEHLLPAFDRAPGADDVALAARLGSLSLPPVAGAPTGEGFDAYTASRGSGAGLTVRRDGTGWVIGTAGVEVPLGTGEWRTATTGAPGGGRITLATSGAWDEHGDLRASIAFVETPHTLDVTARADGTAELTWRAGAPLHVSPLLEMHAPGA